MRTHKQILEIIDDTRKLIDRVINDAELSPADFERLNTASGNLTEIQSKMYDIKHEVIRLVKECLP